MLNIKYVCVAPSSKLSDDVHYLIDPPQRVFLSMFTEEMADSADGSRLVRYPDIKSSDPVIEGKVRFIIDDPYINKSEVFSLELTNPSWKDILQEANNMLKDCDVPIGFLENILPRDAGTYQLIFSH